MREFTLPFMEIRLQRFPSNQCQRAGPRIRCSNASEHRTKRRRRTQMTTKQKTVIVTGASQGIGAAIANSVPRARLQRSGQLAQYQS